jgi:hypothetical protein
VLACHSHPISMTRIFIRPRHTIHIARESGSASQLAFPCPLRGSLWLQPAVRGPSHAAAFVQHSVSAITTATGAVRRSASCRSLEIAPQSNTLNADLPATGLRCRFGALDLMQSPLRTKNESNLNTALAAAFDQECRCLSAEKSILLDPILELKWGLTPVGSQQINAQNFIVADKP